MSNIDGDKIIKQVNKILDKYEKEKSFLDIKDFLPFAKMIIIIAYKGNGKSYSAMKYAIENMLNGNEFAWGRNTEIELESSDVSSSFTEIINSKGIQEEYGVRARGVFKLDPNNKFSKGLLKGIFYTVNKAGNLSSQNALNKCNYIVYDEFINPEFSKKNLFADTMKLFHTLMRKNEAHVILLGNKHEAANDILTGLGIEFEWENEARQIIYDDERSILALYLNKWEINDMNKSNSLIEKWSMYSPEMRRFNKGGVGNNNMYDVIGWEYHKIDKDFKPLFNYDLNDTRYCVGIYKKVYTYVKQLDINEYETLKTYCYFPKDKKPNNMLILDANDLDTVEYLIRQYAKGCLYFSSKFGSDEFKKLLPFLKTIYK